MEGVINVADVQHDKDDADGDAISSQPLVPYGDRRGDRLHQHHRLHHIPHLFSAVHSPAPRYNPLHEHDALCHIFIIQ